MDTPCRNGKYFGVEVDGSELEKRTAMMDLEDIDAWSQMRHRVYRNLDEIYAGK